MGIEIREENILTGLNQNKKLIKEANRNNKRLQEETINKKQGAINSKMHLENNLLLDIQQNNQRLSDEIQNDANLPEGIKLPKLNNNRSGVGENARGDIQDE